MSVCFGSIMITLKCTSNSVRGFVSPAPPVVNVRPSADAGNRGARAARRPRTPANHPILLFGSLGACHKTRGPRDGGLSAYLRFLIFVFRLADPLFKREPRMRRIDLAAITLEGWSRLDDRQRRRFAEMFLRAALRLGGPELRRLARRRGRTPPLPPPVDSGWFCNFDHMGPPL